MKTVLRMGMKSKFNHIFPLHPWLHKGTSPPCTMGTGGGAPLPYGTLEKDRFCGFFSTLLLCDLHKLLEKWKELNVMAFGSAFPAWCRYFLPNTSKMVIHRTGCTFLSALCSLKNQWWQTWSPKWLFCALPWLWPYPKHEDLVLVSSRTHLQGPATHCRGRRKSSEWLFDPLVPTPVYILMWSEKPSTKAVFKFWEKCADPCLMQCHRLGTTPAGRSSTAGWWKDGLVAHGWLICTPNFPRLAQ